MLFAPMEIDATPAMRAGSCSVSFESWDADTANRDCVTERQLSTLTVGDARYKLRHNRMGYFLPGANRTSEFIVPAIEYVGEGMTVDEAFDDWVEQVHIDFQSLFAMRPFEMDKGQIAKWACLSEFIDVPAYRAATPMKIRRTGVVQDARPSHHEVKWEDGTTERVSINQMPGEFASYKPGQPFEAIVVYDHSSKRMARVEFIARRRGVKQTTPVRLEELWSKMKSSNECATTTWDEPQLGDSHGNLPS